MKVCLAVLFIFFSSTKAFKCNNDAFEWTNDHGCNIAHRYRQHPPSGRFLQKCDKPCFLPKIQDLTILASDYEIFLIFDENLCHFGNFENFKSDLQNRTPEKNIFVVFYSYKFCFLANFNFQCLIF